MPDNLQTPPSRLQKEDRRPWYLSPWLLGANTVCLCVMAGFLVGRMTSGGFPAAPPPSPSASVRQAVPARPDVPAIAPAASVPQASPISQTPAGPEISAGTGAPAGIPSPGGGSAPASSSEVTPGETGDLSDYDALSVPESGPATDDWFKDAAVVGDSRVDGLRLYSGIKGAQFIFRTGMNIYEVAEGKQNVRTDGGKASVYDLLSQGQYAKVYLSIGVNELGYFDPEGYAETFGQVIDKVRELQPQAVLYVMTITPVNPAKCREYKKPDYINNDTISQYNDALVKAVREKDVNLLNPAAVLTDESGVLREDLTVDGVHYTKEGYVMWKDYLLAHT